MIKADQIVTTNEYQASADGKRDVWPQHADGRDQIDAAMERAQVAIEDYRSSDPWLWVEVVRCYHKTTDHPGQHGTVIAEGRHGWVVDLPVFGRACYARSVRLPGGEVRSR